MANDVETGIDHLLSEIREIEHTISNSRDLTGSLYTSKMDHSSSESSLSPRKVPQSAVPRYALPLQSSLLASSATPRQSTAEIKEGFPRTLRTPRQNAQTTPRTPRSSSGLEVSPPGTGSGVSGGARTGSRKSGSHAQLLEAQRVIGQLKDDARQMRSDIKLKESALLDTTRELEQLKKRNMVLGTSLSSHRQEIRDLRGEKAVLESLSMRNASQEAGEILSYGGTQSRKTGPAVVSKYLDKSKLKIRELKRENNFLMAALERCDRAMASLKEAIAVIVAQKETTGKSGRGREGELPEDSMREKLKHVLDSLMRVKDQQILPKTQAGASYDAEDGESSDDWMDKGQLPNESNKRTRQVGSLMEERGRLQMKNKLLTRTLERHEKTIKSQHARITSLQGPSIHVSMHSMPTKSSWHIPDVPPPLKSSPSTRSSFTPDKLEALGSSIRESKQRRWVLSAKTAAGQAGDGGGWATSGDADSLQAAEDALHTGAISEGGGGWRAAASGASAGSKTGGKGGPADAGGQVPLEVYEHMEREALLLRTELRDKDNALQERAEVVELLQRKLHVLAHSKDSEMRKIRREAAAAIAGIKMSVGGGEGGGEGKQTPRRMASKAGAAKVGHKTSVAAASVVSQRLRVDAEHRHRVPGDVYSASSLGSFYHRRSSETAAGSVGEGMRKDEEVEV